MVLPSDLWLFIVCIFFDATTNFSRIYVEEERCKQWHVCRQRCIAIAAIVSMARFAKWFAIDV